MSGASLIGRKGIYPGTCRGSYLITLIYEKWARHSANNANIKHYVAIERYQRWIAFSEFLKPIRRKSVKLKCLENRKTR